MLPGLILAKSLAKPRWSGSDGAYSGKIFCCAPLARDPRGLFWQNLLLCPAGPRSPGLIPTKSLATPRWSEIPGAYSGKIFCCAPLIRNRWGLFRQNLLLSPTDPRSPGLILAKSFVAPRWSEIPGAYSGKIFCYAPLVRFLQGTDSLNPTSTPSSAQIHKNTDRQISSLSISIFVCQYLFHQRSVTAGSPSHPRTPAAFLLKETW